MTFIRGVTMGISALQTLFQVIKSFFQIYFKYPIGNLLSWNFYVLGLRVPVDVIHEMPTP